MKTQRKLGGYTPTDSKKEEKKRKHLSKKNHNCSSVSGKRFIFALGISFAKSIRSAKKYPRERLSRGKGVPAPTGSQGGWRVGGRAYRQ